LSNVEIEFDVPAIMRDGTVLRADVYRPTAGGPWPVLLARLPYNKQFAPMTASLDPLAAVRRGYLVVVQDTRGRFASEGDWLPFSHEQSDGYDTVRWAAGLAGSAGIVGMMGGSYFGNTQWMAALAKPPELKALAPSITWSEPHDGLFSRGGAVELGTGANWSLMQGANLIGRRWRDDPRQLAGRMAGLVADIDALASATYWELPVGRFPAFARNGVPGAGFESPDATDACRVAGRHDQIDLPTFNVGGWYDIFSQGTLDNYAAMSRAGRPTKLIMGPWVHGVGFGNQVGELNFGLAANGQLLDLRSSVTELQLDWFDRWLTPGAVGEPDEAGGAGDAPVKLFVMGVNRWRDEQAWPLARARDTAWHLRADGRLTEEPPGADERPDAYVYDPADPVITHGGALLMSSEFTAGAFDQSRVEQRSDVVVFTTEPLAEDLEVTGRVRVSLFAATDGPSTDWVARLCDVDGEGVSRNVTDGILRVHGTPGHIAEHEIDLWSTSIVFRAGHRIRVQVTSSNFPRWDRNLNTGEPLDTATRMRAARQAIFHDSARPSQIVLPVIAS
jgi:putative CocE/NonD family hydrolase